MAGQDLIFGIRAVMEAIEAGKTLERVYMQDGLKSELALALRSLCRTHDVYIHYVPQAKIEGLAREKNHQGVAAYVTELEYENLEEVLPDVLDSGEIPLLVMLDRVTDVRNLGAIARTMDAMGAQALIVPVQGSARINAEAVKSSAGALHHIRLCREKNLRDCLHFLKEAGVRIIACYEGAKNDLAHEDLSGPVCLLLGSEYSGISTELLRMADSEIFIPMKGKMGSLNVSVAAGMVLYEAMCQRK